MQTKRKTNADSNLGNTVIGRNPDETKPLSNTFDFGKRIEIERIADKIRPYVRRTPIVHDENLSERFGSNVYLKLEVLQKTGAFKVRGAFNKMLSMTEEEKQKGVVAVSGGNHAQAVAYVAKTMGFKALIVMPESTPENYVSKTRGYGAEVVLVSNLSEAFKKTEEYEKKGLVNIHPFNDISIIAGQGTVGLEIIEDLPQVTDVVVSIGGGGLASGVATVLKNYNPDIQIWGAETHGADAMSQALEAGEIVTLPEITSLAKTLGAPAVGDLTLELVGKYINGVTVVEDKEAIDELFYLLDHAKVLTELAASCTLAAAEKLRKHFSPTSHVLLILCGGNTGVDDLVEFRKF